MVSGTGDAFQEVAVSAILPPATYKIQVLLVAKRLGGANNDASFDKLDLRIHRLDRARNDRP